MRIHPDKKLLKVETALVIQVRCYKLLAFTVFVSNIYLLRLSIRWTTSLFCAITKAMEKMKITFSWLWINMPSMNEYVWKPSQKVSWFTTCKMHAWLPHPGSNESSILLSSISFLNLMICLRTIEYIFTYIFSYIGNHRQPQIYFQQAKVLNFEF